MCCLDDGIKRIVGYAPVHSNKVAEVCRKVVKHIQRIQDKETEEFVEKYREKINKSRWFWAHFPWYQYKEATTDDIKEELDYIKKYGSVREVFDMYNDYPSITSELWKEKARKLLSLTKSSDKIYVNADDWDVLIRFAEKSDALQKEKCQTDN